MINKIIRTDENQKIYTSVQFTYVDDFFDYENVSLIVDPNPKLDLAVFICPVDDAMCKTMLSFLFSQYQFSWLMILSGFTIIVISSYRLVNEKHLKLICIYFSISNIGFMISAIGMQSIESMQAMFFFMLNFSIINFSKLKKIFL